MKAYIIRELEWRQLHPKRETIIATGVNNHSYIIYDYGDTFRIEGNVRELEFSTLTGAKAWCQNDFESQVLKYLKET